MKINIFYILFLALGLSVSSCNLLDVESPNDIDADNAIETAANAENALLGLYTSMQNKNYYGGMFPLVADALGDNCSTGGFDNPVLDEIGAKTVTPTNGIVEDLWLSLYFTIANCNRLIEALPNIKDLDADRRNAIEGQARTIRAMTHFDLLRSFGYHWDKSSKYGIPLVKTVQGVGDIVPRATVAESFTFIIAELEASAVLVTGDDRSVQFVNPATIKALLARVYLYDKNMTKASDNAAAVINDGSYALLDAATFPAIYSDRRTSESVFELAFDNQNRSNYNALTYSRPDALRTELFFLSNASLATFFEARPGDERATLLNFSTADNDESITSDGSGRTQKYRGEDAKDNPAYLIRLAEMYLIRAEALGLAGGVEDINLLRANRGLSAATPADVAALEQLIWDERRAELNFEGHAFFDIARTGRATAILGDDFRAALPIPLREINATNGAIEQNPQY